MERETLRQIRSIESKFNTRDDDGALHIEGYFAVFNSVYQIWDDMSESVAPGAFTDALGGDVRALIDHETRLVLGRNTAGTLQLREDSHGLWGDILINPDDQDAMNLYARVQRGDVNQCSFGFDILEEETDFRDDGSVHWTIKKVKLYEVSVCTFPAYSETSVQARKEDLEAIKTRKAEAYRAELRARLTEGGTK
jgi:HK97 family phage prohead protease